MHVASEARVTRKLGVALWVLVGIGGLITFNIAFPTDTYRAAATTKRCNLDGQVVVDVGSYRFSIPRRLFTAVFPLTSHGSVDPKCSDLPLRGDGVLLGASATRSGTEFAKDWISEKGLPRRITVRLRGVIKWYPADNFLAKNQLEKHPLGFSVASYGPDTLYDAVPLGLVDHFRRGVVFQCNNREAMKARTCRALYPLSNDFDLGYEFSVRELGPESWVNLDERVREFVAALMVSRN